MRLCGIVLAAAALAAGGFQALSVEPADSLSSHKVKETPVQNIDSISVRDLDEVVVEADRRLITRGGSIYRPISRQKKGAGSATNLLALIDVPELKGDFGQR